MKRPPSIPSKSTLSKSALLALVPALLLPATSRAAIVFTAQEVIVSGVPQVIISSEEGGSLQLGSATLVGTDTVQSTVVRDQNSMLLGELNGSRSVYHVLEISGPAFNTGIGTGVLANSGSGPRTGFNLNTDNFFVPTGYVSGTPIPVSSSKWVNHTFASMGLIPGSYNYTIPNGSGGTDSITLNIGVVPEPGAAALSFAALGLLGCRRRGPSLGVPPLGGSGRSESRL